MLHDYKRCTIRCRGETKDDTKDSVNSRSRTEKPLVSKGSGRLRKERSGQSCISGRDKGLLIGFQRHGNDPDKENPSYGEDEETGWIGKT